MTWISSLLSSPENDPPEASALKPRLVPYSLPTGTHAIASGMHSVPFQGASCGAVFVRCVVDDVRGLTCPIGERYWEWSVWSCMRNSAADWSPERRRHQSARGPARGGWALGGVHFGLEWRRLAGKPRESFPCGVRHALHFYMRQIEELRTASV